jgi:beta-lactamase regulating signal transducer with metallopeptidase domain
MGWFSAPGTLGLVAEYFVKTTAVLTLALIAAAAARRRPAAFRHFVLSFALVGLLLLPILSLAPVGWRTALLPGRPDAGKAPARLKMTRSFEPATAKTATAGTDLVMAVPGQAEAVPEGAPAGSDITFVAAVPVTAASPSSDLYLSLRVRAVPVRDDARAGSALDVALAVLWSAGLAVLVLRLAFGLAAAVKLTAQGKPLADALWRVILERFLALVPLRREVRLKSHPEVVVPLTWGWRKPVILMPEGTELWTAEERSSALFHELSHIKRADFLAMLAVRASLAVFWWNPLTWVVYRELRKEQEIACDELVLRAGIKPSAYAASLLAFRRSAGLGWNPSSALLGLLGRSPFPERLAAILRQKLTFKEVKMRTRIMLAGAVVLAVAFIGTARPAVGVERQTGTTSVVETALPSPDVWDVALPAAEGQELAVAQEKEKEKQKEEKAKAEKEKAASELKFAIEAKQGKGSPLVITITQGDEVKTLALDKPLTITSEKDGDVLVLTTEGKEIKLLKNEPLRLEIKGGEIHVLREGVPIKVGEQGEVHVLREGVPIVVGKEHRPDIGWAIKTDKEGGHIVYYSSKKGAVVGENASVKVVKEGEPAIVWTVKEPGKDKAVWVAKEFSGKPERTAVFYGEGGKAFAFSSAADKDMLEKVRALQEQVQAIKAKKMDITALEESLKKLETELQAKEEKLKELTVKLDKAEGDFKVAKVVGVDEAKAGKADIWISEGGKSKMRVGVSGEANTIQIVDVDKGTTAKDFERVVARLKKDLPEGYSLAEQEFNEEDGVMRFKITRPEGVKVDETVVRKLVDSLKDELKKK